MLSIIDYSHNIDLFCAFSQFLYLKQVRQVFLSDKPSEIYQH